MDTPTPAPRSPVLEDYLVSTPPAGGEDVLTVYNERQKVGKHNALSDNTALGARAPVYGGVLRAEHGGIWCSQPMLGPVCTAAALRDSVLLCLPTDGYSLLVNKLGDDPPPPPLLPPLAVNESPPLKTPSPPTLLLLLLCHSMTLLMGMQGTASRGPDSELHLPPSLCNGMRRPVDHVCHQIRCRRKQFFGRATRVRHPLFPI